MGRPGALGSEDTATRLDGADGSVQCGNARRYRLTRGSFEIWFRSDGAGSGRRTIFGKSGVATIETMNGRLALGVGRRGRLARTRIQVADGAWHHAVATFDRRAGVVRLWLDGKRHLSARLARMAQRSPLAIGAGARGRTFAGSVDEAAVYRVPLSRSAIRGHHAAAG